MKKQFVSIKKADIKWWALIPFTIGVLVGSLIMSSTILLILK